MARRAGLAQSRLCRQSEFLHGNKSSYKLCLVAAYGRHDRQVFFFWVLAGLSCAISLKRKWHTMSHEGAVVQRPYVVEMRPGGGF